MAGPAKLSLAWPLFAVGGVWLGVVLSSAMVGVKTRAPHEFFEMTMSGLRYDCFYKLGGVL